MRHLPALLAVLLFSGAAFAAAMFSLGKLLPEKPESELPLRPAVEAPPEVYQEAVDSLNERLSTIHVVHKGLVIRGESPSFRLSLEPRHSNYFFEGEHYTIDTAGSIHDIPTSDICALIQAVENERQEKILEALDKFEGGGELGTSGASIHGSATFGSLFEAAYAIWDLTKLSGRIQVLIKGYADGEASEWQRNQREGYLFPALPVLMPVPEQRASLNPTVYRKPAERLVLPKIYGNEELPDLRAAFFKNDFVDPMLEGCRKGRSIEVFILKGVDVRGRDEYKRRVDVQLDFDY
jgi:hypothetical protein